MKMLRIGQSSKAGVRRFAPVMSALAVAVCLGAGAAMAQTVNVSTAGTDDTYAPGSTITVEFVFTGSGITTEQITALGWELSGLPAGSAVVTGTPAEQCAEMIVANPGPPAANTVLAKRPEPRILNEGQPNEACNPIVTDGTAPLEFFFLVQQPTEGEATPLPVALPVTVQVQISIPAEATGDLMLSTVNRYRLDAGEELNNEGSPVTETVAEGGPVGCPTVQGDADGSGSVTPGDAQVVFEQFLGLGPVASPECAQCDGDAGGNITPGDAQAIFDVFLGALAQCDGSNG